jgi:phospholipase C
VLGASIQRALAIEPAPGSTYLDAEHVVILMQENRSFDHMYGMLRGVRGFNDPRAVTLPNGNPVWFQTNAAGETYGPFRLDLKNTKATWLGELPHGRRDQGEARNNGRHDRWLLAKTVEDKAYAEIPLTLGYCIREDIPFYYGLADAFTVCDQAFSSMIGPTMPNRLHLWTGTVRAVQSQESRAHVQNEDLDFGAEVSWTSFPERLEECGVSWKNYQNELAVASGLEGDHDGWLSNFGDNPLEFFTQYGVYYHGTHLENLRGNERRLVGEIARLDSAPQPLGEADAERRRKAQSDLQQARGQLVRWSAENFAKLDEKTRRLHEKAFVTNRAHSEYRELSTLRYTDTGEEREMVVPKGDVLFQFREDVRTGNLPAVSWLIPPERLSDHPSNPWYGPLYISEALDILTQNPEVWRKTIFILCYDENDGYFDHIPPFVPPRADRTDTGAVSAGIDTSCEHVLEDPRKDLHDDGPGEAGRDGPIGLGYRVPLVVASPWSRGGYVCSQVFDHTSVLRFLENFATAKSGRAVKETNISKWRRTVCGDLSSVFRPFESSGPVLPAPLVRDTFLAQINRSQFRPVPRDYEKVPASELAAGQGSLSSRLPRQEPGVRPSCALPYELEVDALVRKDGTLAVSFAAGNTRFGRRSSGAPFHVYSPSAVRKAGPGPESFEPGRVWSYAVSAGDRIEGIWPLADFKSGHYHLRAHGPNGFFREFQGATADSGITVTLKAIPGTEPGADLGLSSAAERSVSVLIEDVAYGEQPRRVTLGASGSPASQASLRLGLAGSSGWYDLRITVEGESTFRRRYAGRIETGVESISDPQMGGVA